MVQSQEAVKKEYGINWSGFVKTDVFYDSRQTVNIREGHFLLYPSNELSDKEGKDINDKGSFNILSIQSRLSASIYAPDAFGAKTSGLIEADFFGNENANFSDVNGFRVRHAYGSLKWSKTEFIAGQTWHPFFVAECFPGVVSFNTGVPFQPFSRNPQLRVTRTIGPINVLLAALAQRDFTSPQGSVTLRNSSMPDMQFQIQYKSESLFAGAGVGYKTLVPRLATDSNLVTDKSVSGLSMLAYAKLTTKPVTIKVEGVYGENLFDLIMLGGYSYKYTEDTAIINKNDYDFVTLNNVAAWADLQTNGKKWQFGVFGGYTKNLGAKENILDWTGGKGIFARGSNIAYVYRVSPRVVWISNRTRLALECEYTTAAYGNAINSLAEVQEKSSTEYPNVKFKEMSNIRALFALYYMF